MTDTSMWSRGRKEMIEYLRQPLMLPKNPDDAWRKIRRWKDKYGLPVEAEPNGRPFIDHKVFNTWWTRFRKKRKEQSTVLTTL